MHVSFAKWSLFNIKKKLLKSVNINFGPQHPAAHGVLRLIIAVDSEVIANCDPHIGLLHRGTEKLIENKIYVHSLPYFDRLDYVSTICQENVYCTAVDRASRISYNTYINSTRSLYDELTRILNHLLAISCHALDVGSMSSIFWAFEEREKIMEFYERFSGARMHTALYKPIIFERYLSKSLVTDISFFCKNSYILFNEIHNLLTNNKVWKDRLVNNAKYNYFISINNSLTGVMSRATGIKNDLRLNKTLSYNNYTNLNFKSYTSLLGDSYGRYLLRMSEMSESCNIINQTIASLKNINKTKKKINSFKKKYMESIIDHFKYWSSGFSIQEDLITSYIESPKGEFSILLISDGSEKPFRCKIRSPSFAHLQFLKTISISSFISDLVTLIGTIDIVFGEIDR